MKLLFCLLLIEIVVQIVECNLHGDALILQKCLSETNGRDDLLKLRNYSDWTKEEIPCFTRCLADAKGWFDIEQAKWKKQQIVDDLGSDMYNYCRFELDRPVVNACDFAHKGLKCLKKAEWHSAQSNAALLQCVNEMNVSNEQLERYTQLPVEEEVPCLFKCFADKMKLYSADHKNWNYKNWVDAFGPPKLEDQTAHETCKASEELKKRSKNECSWMYGECLCLEQMNSYFKVQQVSS